MVCSFTAPTRASQRLVFSEYYESGRIEAELVPQGTLAERMRAAGAGIPAFYTPPRSAPSSPKGARRASSTAANTCSKRRCRSTTPLSAPGRPTRPATSCFRRSQRNFNPLMAMAAKVTIVEVEEDILPRGAIDPDDVHTSGIFVHRLVKIPPPPEGWWPMRPAEIAARAAGR